MVRVPVPYSPSPPGEVLAVQLRKKQSLFKKIRCIGQKMPDLLLEWKSYDSENKQGKGGPAVQIGTLVKTAGISTHTTRFYERLGLLGARARSHSGYRLYDQKAVDLPAFVEKARNIGFTLQEIKATREIRDSGDVPCGYVRELA
jgi:hypothetical protein